jgi:tRNA threonylcarbamoyladenosine biosynthesis protein TsaE
MILLSHSTEDTRALGAQLSAAAQPGDIYALEGDLGSGKTEFARGFVAQFDASVTVRSPSFSIVNTYLTGRCPVYHFDFYRLGDVSELFEIGFEEYIGGNGICLIEWASMFPSALPYGSRRIHFRETGATEREIAYHFVIR